MWSIIWVSTDIFAHVSFCSIVIIHRRNLGQSTTINGHINWTIRIYFQYFLCCQSKCILLSIYQHHVLYSELFLYLSIYLFIIHPYICLLSIHVYIYYPSINLFIIHPYIYLLSIHISIYYPSMYISILHVQDSIYTV